jgi:hypothetical protein
VPPAVVSVTAGSFDALMTATGVLALLLDGLVSLAASVKPVTLTTPVCGAVNVTPQVITLLAVSTATGVGGVQLTTAPAGKPAAEQVACCASMAVVAPQVMVPVTVLPGVALAGKPVNATCISAAGISTVR